MFTTVACTTEQHGGWKSKGGSNKPVVPPTFSSGATAERIGPMTIMVSDPYQQLYQDVLICEKSSTIEKQQFTLNYDVIGSLVGFQLFELQTRQIQTPIRTLLTQDDTQWPSLHEMELADISSSKDHLEKLVHDLGVLDPAFAAEISKIMETSTHADPQLPPQLQYFKTSDDGRKCFTTNLLEEDFTTQSYMNLNSDLYAVLSPADQSMLSLFTAVSIFSRRFGMIDLPALKSFVYYAHTKDFQTDIEDASLAPEHLHQLILTFLPEYERTKPEN